MKSLNKAPIYFLLYGMTILALLLSACGSGQQTAEHTLSTPPVNPPEHSLEAESSREDPAQIANSGLEENTEMKMNVQIGTTTFTATLENNAAVDALVAMLESGPITIQMSDYAGFEKVGALGASLPTSSSQTTTQAGDIVLYQGDQIVIFYGSNSWNYTRLGRIDDLTGWDTALGSGDVSVIFSLVA